MSYLNRHKSHKNLAVRISIIELVPDFAQSLLQVFETYYFEVFVKHFLETLSKWVVI